MSQRFLRILPRLVAVMILVNLALLMGCGGSAGVDNGRIVGKVFSNLRDRSAQRLPEPGVSIVAQREGGTPPLIRTTVTDQNGVYSFPDLPTGAYVIGFAKEGFITIDTSAGATTSRTALGSQVRVFIDSGRTSVAPDVTMRAQTPSGDATFIVTVRDRLTEKLITDAVVSVGAVSQTKNSNGVYTLTVPLPRTSELAFTTETSITVQVSGRAEGFKNFGPEGVRALPGETTRFTMVMGPLDINDANSVSLEGSYRFSKFQNLLSLTQNIRLHVRNQSDVGLTETTGRLDPTSGKWIISGLPPTTSSIVRTVDLVFEHPDIETRVLQAQILPKSGTKTIIDTVVLTPTTVDVIGRARITQGTASVIPLVDPSSFALIGDLGIKVPLGQDGNFFFEDVPTRSDPAAAGFNIAVQGIATAGGVIQNGSFQNVRPVKGDSGSTTFDVGTVILTGGGQ